MSTINFSEYNEVHLRRADHLVSFVKNLEHAMQKTNDYNGAMHQLQCIGFSEELIKEMAAVASDYKKYHKQRIQDEQTAGTPEKLYPMIDPARVKQYAKNCELISAIDQHKDVEPLTEQIAIAIEEELEVNIGSFLKAYMDCDVDRMVSAITGWDLEALLAKARVIPDKMEHFYKPGDFPLSEVAFPFFGKQCLSIAEFKDYLLNAYTLEPSTLLMVENAIAFAQKTFVTSKERNDCLWAMLNGAVDVPEEVVRLVAL